MEVFVARQPIFQKSKRIFGYELLFRGGTANSFPDVDKDAATFSLLSNSFLNLGIESIVGAKRAFINFTGNLLLSGLPLMFPRDKIIVEILEEVEPTGDLIDVCRDFKGRGYNLALDDFYYESRFDPLIELAEIVKIDFRARSLDEIEDSIDKMSSYNVKFLAEKVETYDEFNRALDMGFQYFQGYLFSEPEILTSQDISIPACA